MIRTCCLFVALVLFAFSADVHAGQRRPQISEEMKAKIGARLDQAEMESGLTQEDIDKYIAFIHDVKKARGKQKNIDKAIEKSGRSETRLLYIKMKTDMACMIANGLPEAVFKDVTPAFHATEEEKALILANLERLTSTSFVAEFPMPR